MSDHIRPAATTTGIYARPVTRRAGDAFLTGTPNFGLPSVVARDPGSDVHVLACSPPEVLMSVVRDNPSSVRQPSTAESVVGGAVTSVGMAVDWLRAGPGSAAVDAALDQASAALAMLDTDPRVLLALHQLVVDVQDCQRAAQHSSPALESSFRTAVTAVVAP